VIANQNGLLVHHGDCDIHRAKEMHSFAACTCGLLHDLRWLEWSLVEKMYPKFGDELVHSDMTWEMEQEAKGREPISHEETLKIFKEAGFKINDDPPTEEELKKIEARDKEHWESIEYVFGKEYVEYLNQQNDASSEHDCSHDNSE